MITRRLFLAFPLALSLLFMGCTTLPEQQKIASVASDVVLLADAFTNVLPALSGVQGIDPADLQKIGENIAALKLLAEKIRDANTTVVAKPLVEQVVANAQAVISTLATVQAIPPEIRNILTAASVLLPVIQVAVNIIVPKALGPAGMKPEDARTVLINAAK